MSKQQDLFPVNQSHAVNRGWEIAAAFVALGRKRATVGEITAQVARSRRARGERVPLKIRASVRNGLQRHSEQSPHYCGHTPLFYPVDNNGTWEFIAYKEKSHERG